MFFKIGDIASPIIIAAITAFAVLMSIAPGGSMIGAMIIGMLWGMASQIIVLLVLMPLFGAFEVMIPAMLAGNLSGMATAMMAASGSVGAAGIMGCGLLIGLFVYGWVFFYNRRLHGEQNNDDRIG